jgi:hypothetical protein
LSAEPRAVAEEVAANRNQQPLNWIDS